MTLHTEWQIHDPLALVDLWLDMKQDIHNTTLVGWQMRRNEEHAARCHRTSQALRYLYVNDCWDVYPSAMDTPEELEAKQESIFSQAVIGAAGKTIIAYAADLLELHDHISSREDFTEAQRLENSMHTLFLKGIRGGYCFTQSLLEAGDA